MGQDVRKVINIIGVALFLGIALRYSTAVQGLLGSGASAFQKVYSTVSMQDIPSLNQPTSTGPNWGR